MTTTSSILRDNSKALYQPWREEAFRADEYVQALAPVEKWMLRALLQAAFVCSQRPYLPDDDARLWVLAGCESRNQWDQHSAAVRSLFTPIELDGQKLLSQKKLVHDWDRLSKVRLARAEAGRKGGLANSEANHQDDHRVKANGSEAKPTEEKQTEPNLTNRSEVREVSCLPIGSNSPAIGRVAEKAGGMDGISPTDSRSSADAADNGPKGSGQEKLSGWRFDFQRKVQTAAAEHEGASIVFLVPLPPKVFRWVEQMADKCGIEGAQTAVIDWLEARSFNGLANPNVVWDKMEDEILPFVPENQRVLRAGKT